MTMTPMYKTEPVLLCGREFRIQELEDIQETIRMFPLLSRKELAYTICEHLEWVSPNGKYKVESCTQLLKKLEAHGLLELPALRKHTATKQSVEARDHPEAGLELTGSVSGYAPIELEAVQGKPQSRIWNEYLQCYHPLGYKRPFGAHQKYYIVGSYQGTRRQLGCMLFAAAAWALADRDNWVGWSQEDRSQKLHYIVNNTRLLIFPWIKVKNLASHALSVAAKQIGPDWQGRYGYQPALLETFVDKEKYHGSCYRAANWVLLGETAGRGRMDRYHQNISTPKYIFVYPLRQDFRDILCGKGGHSQ